MAASEAVVISGAAPISAVGTGRQRSWEALVGGESGVAGITRFDTAGFPVKLAGEVRDLGVEHPIDGRLLVATDRWTQLGVTATDLALTDAAVDLAAFDPYRVAVITASASGGNEFGQGQIEALWSRGPKAVSVYQSIAWFYAATTGQLSIRHGSKGTCGVLAGAGPAGLDALAHARRALASGTDIAIVGAMESGLSPYAMTCQMESGFLSHADDAATAYQPFGRDARGYVVGEGGAMLVLERATQCTRRGGRALAQLSGHASSQDGRRRGHRDPGVAGRGLAEAVGMALRQAGLTPDQIDVVFADGAGVPPHDDAELAALRAVFGDGLAAVAVTVPKAATGRMEAGSAAFDVATAVSALDAQVIPPTASTGALIAPDIDLAREARPAALHHVLVLARGHGGFNTAVVLSRPQ